jgi:hypothetical protein
MPHITVRGISKQKLCSITADLKKAVVEASEAKEEYVKIFYSPVCRVDKAEEISADVYWMPRSQEICDKVAHAITTFFKSTVGGFVQVTFTEFPGSHFYEDDIHY